MIDSLKDDGKVSSTITTPCSLSTLKKPVCIASQRETFSLSSRRWIISAGQLGIFPRQTLQLTKKQ